MTNAAQSNAAFDARRTVGPWRVPALGAGTWALGGRWDFAGAAAGWGDVDDEVSIAAIRAAYEGGVQLSTPLTSTAAVMPNASSGRPSRRSATT